MKILVKNNKERVRNQEVEMKKVQKLLRRSLATGLALVMTVSSMTIVPGLEPQKPGFYAPMISIFPAVTGHRSEEAAAVSMPSFPVNVFLTVRLTEPVM